MEGKKMKTIYIVWIASNKKHSRMYMELHSTFMSAQMATIRYNAALPKELHADFVRKDYTPTKEVAG